MGLLTGGWLASALGFRYNGCFSFCFLVPAASVCVDVLLRLLCCYCVCVDVLLRLLCSAVSYSILSMNLLFFVPTVTVLVHEFALMFFCLDMTYKVDWALKTNN